MNYEYKDNLCEVDVERANVSNAEKVKCYKNMN
jgi:hypothetical protein